jgi:hypothetical protein
MRDGLWFSGTHLILELQAPGCATALVERALLASGEVAGATLLKIDLHAMVEHKRAIVS